MTAAAPLRIGIAVHSFPTLSETFVLEPVVELLRRDHDVQILALYRGPQDPVHPTVEEHGLLERTRFLIDTRPGRGRLRKAVSAAARVARRRARSLPWARIGADLRGDGLVRLAPEIISSAVGGAVLSPPEGLRYDVVHAHSGRVGLVTEYLRRWGVVDAPLVVSFHGSDALVEPGRYSRHMYDRLFEGADLITANTDFLKDTLATLGAPMGRSRRLPVGVDLDRLEFHPRGWTPGEPLRLLTVARLIECKGLPYGITAVETLLERGIDVHYTIVGDGPRRGALDALIRRKELDSSVTLTGGLPWNEVKAAYDEHHVFLLPGIIARDGSQEAQGKVLLEAQGSGMPWVASDVGGVAEVVAPGSGKLVEPGSSKAIVGAVEQLLERHAHWPEMGRRGRRYVEASFTNQRLVDVLLDLYVAVCR